MKFEINYEFGQTIWIPLIREDTNCCAVCGGEGKVLATLENVPEKFRTQKALCPVCFGVVPRQFCPSKAYIGGISIIVDRAGTKIKYVIDNWGREWGPGDFFLTESEARKKCVELNKHTPRIAS